MIQNSRANQLLHCFHHVRLDGKFVALYWHFIDCSLIRSASRRQNDLCFVCKSVSSPRHRRCQQHLICMGIQEGFARPFAGMKITSAQHERLTLQTLTGDGGSVLRMEFDNKEDYLLVSYDDMTNRMWDLDSELGMLPNLSSSYKQLFALSTTDPLPKRLNSILIHCYLLFNKKKQW